MVDAVVEHVPVAGDGVPLVLAEREVAGAAVEKAVNRDTRVVAGVVRAVALADRILAVGVGALLGVAHQTVGPERVPDIGVGNIGNA